MSTPKATSVFHFTKSVEVLKSILLNGFYPHYSLEDMTWFDEQLEPMAFPMVCFCDIPIGRIVEHVEFYGSYGVGLTKEWAQKNRLNPITYVSSSSLYKDSLVEVIKAANKVEGKADKEKDKRHHFYFLLTYAKPLVGVMTVNGAPVKKDFYQENEWRFSPRAGANDAHIMFQEDWPDQAKRKEKNEAIRATDTLAFSPQDVRYIFVPTDADIPQLVNFINEKMDKYPSADLKILLTRITSLEMLQKDL